MDETWMRAMEVEISKVSYLLENLYAVSFKDHGSTPEDVDDVADEICRQAMLPATAYGSEPDHERLHEFQEMLAHRLAMFFVRVRGRVVQEQ